ncbi:hypothetical protein K7432_004902 [Basidiobolus ranarum]|uniref:Uncharacterized protein n=1 Tax=Basidiobolus ranarum TaxID=34480 RepID=A0ABR2WXD8_9FUNG
MIRRATTTTANVFDEYIGPTNAKCVAAIDFGTSGTGYAYAFPGSDGIKDARTALFSNGPWADGKDGKTKTALLLDENNKIMAFGKVAQKKYQSIAMKYKSDIAKYQAMVMKGNASSSKPEIKERYFECFKMNLYKTSVSGKMLISAANGVKIAAQTVFSESLKYIKKTLLAQIDQSTNGISERDIKWVLTVPAIWSDAAKQVMREAAELAGLKGVALQLALEPEAASLWALQSNDLSMDPDSKYMICDCGGGTIDVTVHEVDYSQRKVKEAFAYKLVIPADGGDWGSTTIDQRVLQLLEEIFGKNRYLNMTEDPLGFLKIKEDIEMAKITFDEDTDIVLVVPDSLTAKTHGDTTTAAEAMERFCEKKNAEFFLIGQNLMIPADYFYENCMKPTITQTVTHVRNIVKNNTGISKIILVGNFANCRQLQKQFIQEFRYIEVKVPTPPGAVLFGADPGLVTQRKSRFTYGHRISAVFDEAVHDEYKSFRSKAGRKYCQDIFAKFVLMGENLEVGKEVTRTYQTVEKRQSTMDFIIYKAPRRDVKYITDTLVEQIGSFSLECSGREDR